MRGVFTSYMNTTKTARDARLEILATGSSCPRCGAYADESCTTPKGNATDPHEARVLRAVKQHVAARNQKGI